MNDTYRIEGLTNASRGGMARVRTIRRDMQAEHGDLLVLHAGDMLYPSLLSRHYKGAQMIDALNGLDGDGSGFDPRLFVIFGNHEFDRSKMKYAGELHRRLLDSQFTWLNANISFKQDESGVELLAAGNHLPFKMIEINRVKVGLFGISALPVLPEYVAGIDPPIDTALRLSTELKRRGAEVVIALTHLPMAKDVSILESLGVNGPDLIFGGHEHFNQVRTIDGVKRIFKADADAVTVFATRVHIDAKGEVSAEPELLKVDSSIIPDTELESRVEYWLWKHDRQYCADVNRSPGCLDLQVGSTRVALIAEELKIRSTESNIGSWIMDQALLAFKDQGAQVAFVNSGGLRLNHDLPPGPITERHVTELFAYPSPMYLIEIDGRTLKQVAQRAVTGYPGKGWWLQVAGFAYRHYPYERRIGELTLLTPAGPRSVRDGEKIRAVVNNFLIDPAIGNQDGYTMINKDQIINPDLATPDLKQLVRDGLNQAGAEGIAPRVMGRICNMSGLRTAPCLAVEP